MAVITTLSFAGRTEEALGHYQDALGAELVFLMRFRDSPDASHHRKDIEELVFHATFRIEGTEFMASDVGYFDEDATAHFAGFALALRLRSVDRARRFFDALAEGGRVIMPLAESAFTSWYGIVEDRFGVSWKFNVDTK